LSPSPFQGEGWDGGNQINILPYFFSMQKKIFFLIFLAIAIFSSNIFAAPHHDSDKAPLLNAVTQQLSVEQAHNQLLIAKLKVLQNRTTQKIIIQPDSLKRASVAISLAKADQEGTTITLNAAEQAVQLTQSSLDNLLQNTTQTQNFSKLDNLKNNQFMIQQNELKALLKLQQERVKSLQETQSLAAKIVDAAEHWKSELEDAYQLQQQTIRQNNLNQLATSLQKEQQVWLTRLAKLNQQLQKTDIQGFFNKPAYIRLEMDIFEAEEKSDLSQVQLEIARLRNHLEDLSSPPTKTQSLSTLNTEQHQLYTLQDQLEKMQQMLKSKIELLQKRISITTDGLNAGMLSYDEAQTNLQMMAELSNNYQTQLDTTVNLFHLSKTDETTIIARLNKQLANRQGLPGLDLQAWINLGEKIIQIPLLTGQLIQSWYKPIILGISSAPVWQLILWFVGLGAWGTLWLYLRRVISAATQNLNNQRDRFTNHKVLFISLPLLQRHLTFLMLLGGFIGSLFLLGIPVATFSLIISLSIVILIFSFIHGFARYLLLENTENKSGADVKLYYRLKRALWIGGIVTALTVLVHQLPLSYEVQDLFGRLFMLFLLLVSLVLLRSWSGLPALLGGSLENSRPYVQEIVKWLSLLIPLTLLSNALIGLVGYVELAWSIAAYQGIFLIVLTGYLFASGLLGELMRLISSKIIRNLKNGWLWSEAILKPIHLILKIILLITAFVVLFKWYGWDAHSWVVIKLNQLLHLRLFVFAGSIITPDSLIKLLIILAILIWATQWTREFAYRWLFSRVKDLGLRNSLSIFSRYLMLTFGVLIALHVVGINLTALTFIASAFAFGVGLGLRDLANNFVSGILLLIERPVRVGDYITVGTNEGEVTHIGMRSITVRTDDRQELLVPNANVFSQSFINWTHRDSIVRAVVPLKINRVDDPHRVRDIILNVLKSIPEILSKPPAVVYLRRMDEALIEFQVQFYIDMKNSSRDAMKSKALLALWDQFKVEGIHAPETAHEIILKKDDSSEN
jgi:potassium efflux system protein